MKKCTSWADFELFSHLNSLLSDTFLMSILIVNAWNLWSTYFYTRKLNEVVRSYIKQWNFRELRHQNEHSSRFSNKTVKTSFVRKLIDWNSNSIIFTEKWKNVIRRIFIFVATPLNFIDFRPLVDLKIALGSFTLIFWRLSVI